jgi:hypothetical protein
MPVITAAWGGGRADEAACRCADGAPCYSAADGASGRRTDRRARDTADGRTCQGTILLDGLAAGEGNRGSADD